MTRILNRFLYLRFSMGYRSCRARHGPNMEAGGLSDPGSPRNSGLTAQTAQELPS